tara:strand:- start:436 stop:606 length:171 start_codon:yes stop_codon:yes gene_type:complete
MNIKKLIGWVLAFTGVALFTGILVESSGLKAVMMAYGIIALIVAFITFVVWLLADD